MVVMYPKTLVRIPLANIDDAMIVEVHIGCDLEVWYDVRYWYCGSCYTPRLHSSEIERKFSSEQSVGFLYINESNPAST